MRSFLELVQAACDEIGIPQPASIVGNVDDQSRQILALANREGKEFFAYANDFGGWQNLQKEYIFTTTALPSTTGDTTSGSPVITNIPSTVGITALTWTVTGESIPYQAKVISVDSPTQVTIDRVASETSVGTDLTFGQAAYSLPSDFEYFVQKTYWDTSFRWQLLGPISAQEKNVLRYGISPSGPRRKFYIMQNLLWLDPTPPDDEYIAFDYYSNAWCTSSGGTAQTAWLADTDLYKLDEDCFIQGMKWRYLRSKGLDYAEELNSYEKDRERVRGRDGGNRDLPLNARTGLKLLSSDQVPDTGFGT